MTPFYKITNKIQAIIALRAIVIVIQLALIFFVNIGLAYHLPWVPLLSIIAIEVVFTFFSYLYFRQYGVTENQGSQKAILLQICADIIFLSLILFFSGGATNAFVSLLLIPIAIAAVTLPPTLLAVVSFLAICSYSVLLWLLPMSVMHGNMQGHFIGMGINFLFSALVVAIVVGKMARSINLQELAILRYQENLLKQEQVTALGTASAQVTHQLATPIATVQLLVDELNEEQSDNPVIKEMQTELKRCQRSLSEFRTMVFDIKEQVIKPLSGQVLFDNIVDNVHINYPEIKLQLESNLSAAKSDMSINTDAALLPALLNLINNAVRASKANGNNNLCLTSHYSAQQWQFSIRDFGKGFTLSELEELGVKPVDSDHGFGMAVLLSHTSLERIGGKLALTNHQDGGALVTISLPTLPGGIDA